jgi:lipopolysaccharide/colanic/teichoic acid biosynthesis glycosyltransferase
MQVGSDKKGPGVTAHGDTRVTPVGRFLRQFKLDELPQLWNVLWGDMSFVGPRPEVPLYVQMYDESQRSILCVRPGITDLASLVYRNEEKILAATTDPERYYIEVLIADKIRLNMQYIASISLLCDLRLIINTLLAVQPLSPSNSGSSESGDKSASPAPN